MNNPLRMRAVVYLALLIFGLNAIHVQPATSQSSSSSSTRVEYLSPELEEMLSTEISTAISKAIVTRSFHVPGSLVTITAIRLESKWGIATIVSTKSPEYQQHQAGQDWGIMQPDLTGAVLFVQTETGWQAAINQTREFDTLASAIPVEELSLQAREAFQGRPSTPEAGTRRATDLKFPWRCNESWELTQGWHSDFYGSNALDYAPRGTAGRDVVSVTDATVIGLCNPNNGNFQVQVRTRSTTGNDWYYLHLSKADGFPGIGEVLTQGEYVGKIVWDWDFADSCGSGTGPHLHLTAPSKYYTMDDWTVNGGNTWTRPGYSNKTVGDTFQSTNSCSNCCCSSIAMACADSLSSSGLIVEEPTEFPSEWDWTSTAELDLVPEPTRTSVALLFPMPEVPQYVADSGTQSTPHPVVELQRIPPSSAGYRISRSVFSSGGGTKTSTNYVMNSAQGQSTDLSPHASVSYKLVPGYFSRWTPALNNFKIYLPLIHRNH